MILKQLPEAEEEVNQAVDHYEQKTSGLGLDFLFEVETGFSAIIQAPERWPRISPRVRRYLLRRFPYGIMYEVKDDIVLVIAVANLRRRPNYWRRRLR
jgi:hypothetical protein